jgi:hypothetical protein
VNLAEQNFGIPQQASSTGPIRTPPVHGRY